MDQHTVTVRQTSPPGCAKSCGCPARTHIKALLSRVVRGLVMVYLHPDFLKRSAIIVPTL